MRRCDGGRYETVSVMVCGVLRIVWRAEQYLPPVPHTSSQESTRRCRYLLSHASVWSQVPDTLATIQAQRYTVFSLITDKARIHPWQSRLELGHLQPYAPRALAQMLDPHRYPEMAAADRIYVVTNATNSTALAADKRWHIVQLQPLAP